MELELQGIGEYHNLFHLPVCKTLAPAPFDVLGYGARLLLGKRAHDGYQQLSLAVKRFYIFFLEIDFYFVFLEARPENRTPVIV